MIERNGGWVGEDVGVVHSEDGVVIGGVVRDGSVAIGGLGEASQGGDKRESVGALGVSGRATVDKDLFDELVDVHGIPFQNYRSAFGSQVFYSAWLAGSFGGRGRLNFLQIGVHAPTVGSRVEVDVVPVVTAGGDGAGDYCS